MTAEIVMSHLARAANDPSCSLTDRLAIIRTIGVLATAESCKILIALCCRDDLPVRVSVEAGEALALAVSQGAPGPTETNLADFDGPAYLAFDQAKAGYM